MRLRLPAVLLALVVASGGAIALTVGEEITIYDGLGTGSGWTGGPHEDNEVEPGCMTGDDWDLEAFFQNGTMLTMVGTYDFENGASGKGQTWVYGDLFIDVDGDYGASTNTYGYDYVLAYTGSEDPSGNPLYDAYELDNSTVLDTVYYAQNAHANPYRWQSGGTQVVTDGTFSYFTGLNHTLNGGLSSADALEANYPATTTHNAVQVDLGWLFARPDVGNEITLHYTYECGNDNLMGRMIVPEPGTMVLLGLGIAGLATMRMRKSIA